jgi:hypothetical protein
MMGVPLPSGVAAALDATPGGDDAERAALELGA